MSRKRTCAISSSISFFTSPGIPIHLDTFATEEPLNNALNRREQSFGIALSKLAHRHPIHLFFVDSMVPVVQRKERRSPKTARLPSGRGEILFAEGADVTMHKIRQSPPLFGDVLSKPSKHLEKCDLPFSALFGTIGL